MFRMYRDQKTHLPLAPTPATCAGATYIVTGANTGLGFECAQHLVRLRASRVILGVRSLSKGEAAKSRIEANTGVKGVAEVWHIDMSSYDSVKEFAERVKGLDRVDAVIENAAVAAADFVLAEGLESTLTINVVSTTLLAVLVLPKLEESAKRFGISPHLVAVGSGAAFGAKGELEKYGRGDILDAVSQDVAKVAKRYPVSKLMEFYAIRQLALLKPVSKTGVAINYVNPGLCVTELSRNAPFYFWLMIKMMQLLMGRTAEEGSRTLLQAAVAGKESHGQYMSECQIKDFRVPPWVKNDAGANIQERVWESVSKKLNVIQPGCI